MNLSEEELQELLKNPDVKVDPHHSQFKKASVVATTPLSIHGEKARQGMAGEKRGTTPEKDFQRSLIVLLHTFHYKVCEFRKARVKKDGVDTYRTPFGADGVGHPDLLAVHPESGNSFYVECKSDKGVLSCEQKDWLDWLRKCGHTYFMWRPRDWDYAEAVIKKLAQVE